MRLLLLRWTQLGLVTLVLLMAVCGTVAASDTVGRSAALSHQMMCTCGCAQVLGECNHVGCPNSGGMLQKLHRDVALGMSDRAILLAFSQEYGQTVLASPMFTRWNRAAWFIPPGALLLGLFGAFWTIRRWRGTPSAAGGATVASLPAGQGPYDAALERVRRETENG